MKKNIWIKSKIINICKWNNNLFSIFLKNNIKSFIPGQFTKLSLKINNKYIYRFYSFVNSYKDDFLEFYISKIKNGYFTNILYNLNIGDYIYISYYSYGNFIIYNFIKNKNIKYLWMICNGTGISPFLSILSSNYNIIKFNFLKVILVYGTDYFYNFIYLNKLLSLQNLYGYSFLNLNFFLSKEKNKIKLPFFFNGRVSNISFYKKFQIINDIIIDNYSYFMLCGSNIMLKDVYNFLVNKFNICKKSNIFSEVY